MRYYYEKTRGTVPVYGEIYAVPAVGLALAIPESREYLKSKFHNVREKVKNLLPKEKGL